MKKCDKCWGTGKPVDHVAIGRDVRARRESRARSLSDLARRLGISAPYLSLLENGKRAWTKSLYEKATKER